MEEAAAAWNRFPIKTFDDWLHFVALVETSHFEIDTCRSESSQK